VSERGVPSGTTIIPLTQPVATSIAVIRSTSPSFRTIPTAPRSAFQIMRHRIWWIWPCAIAVLGMVWTWRNYGNFRAFSQRVAPALNATGQTPVDEDTYTDLSDVIFDATRNDKGMVGTDWGNARLKVLILRGEMRCAQLSAPFSANHCTTVTAITHYYLSFALGAAPSR
jgi:hypothetical protein